MDGVWRWGVDFFYLGKSGIGRPFVVIYIYIYIYPFG